MCGHISGCSSSLTYVPNSTDIVGSQSAELSYEEHYDIDKVWDRFVKAHGAGKTAEELSCIQDEAKAMVKYACENVNYLSNIINLKQELIAKIGAPVSTKMLEGKVFALSLKIAALESGNGWPLGKVHQPTVKSKKKLVKQSPAIRLFNANPVVHKMANSTNQSPNRKGMLLIKPMGKGTYNNATLVYHQSLKKEFVLRQMGFGRISKNLAEVESDWRSEVKIHRSLNSEGVSGLVRLHEVYVSDPPNTKVRAMLLEKCEGSCNDFVEHPNHLEDSQRISMLKQRITTLTQMHKLKVIHSDYKPGNIFYLRDDQGNLITKIGDLGLAERLTKFEGGIVGSYRYKPLDAFCYKNSKENCARHGILKDSWAEGMVAYELRYGSFNAHHDLMYEIKLFDDAFFRNKEIEEFIKLDATSDEDSDSSMSTAESEDLPTMKVEYRIRLFDQLKLVYPESLQQLPLISVDSLSHYSLEEFINHLYNLFLLAKFKNKFDDIFDKLCHELARGEGGHRGDMEDQMISGLLNPNIDRRLTVEVAGKYLRHL